VLATAVISFYCILCSQRLPLFMLNNDGKLCTIFPSNCKYSFSIVPYIVDGSFFSLVRVPHKADASLTRTSKPCDSPTEGFVFDNFIKDIPSLHYGPLHPSICMPV
jgi:hypothetical protein